MASPWPPGWCYALLVSVFRLLSFPRAALLQLDTRSFLQIAHRRSALDHQCYAEVQWRNAGSKHRILDRRSDKSALSLVTQLKVLEFSNTARSVILLNIILVVTYLSYFLYSDRNTVILYYLKLFGVTEVCICPTRLLSVTKRQSVTNANFIILSLRLSLRRFWF